MRCGTAGSFDLQSSPLDGPTFTASPVRVHASWLAAAVRNGLCGFLTSVRGRETTRWKSAEPLQHLTSGPLVRGLAVVGLPDSVGCRPHAQAAAG